MEQIAEKLGGAANVTRIYGEPVEGNGITVVPVSKAKYGFGGGAGTKSGEEGSGGGGGLMLTPVGYIEIKEGKSRSKTICNPQTLLKIIAVSRLFTLLTARTITRLFNK